MTEQIEKTNDLLEVDNPLPGQNFACLSFLSPEKTMQRKEKFIAKKFIESIGIK